MNEHTLFSESHEETVNIGRAVGEISRRGSVIALIGDLGAGKTVITKGIAAGLNVEEEPTSPTFVIMNMYEGDETLYHFDLYRLSDPGDLDVIGFEDYLQSGGICVIEWADKFIDELPKDTVIIEVSIFEDKDENSSKNKRIIRIKGSPEWVSLFKNTVEQVSQT